MWEFGKARYSLQQQTPEQKTARERMALFPVKHAEVLHVAPELWVPVVRMKGRLIILPGVPRLFEQLLTNYMSNYIALPVSQLRSS
jgi:molybdopterin-biosynthesis enzyme MoeA-like protein